MLCTDLSSCYHGCSSRQCCPAAQMVTVTQPPDIRHRYMMDLHHVEHEAACYAWTAATPCSCFWRAQVTADFIGAHPERKITKKWLHAKVKDIAERQKGCWVINAQAPSDAGKVLMYLLTRQ